MESAISMGMGEGGKLFIHYTSKGVHAIATVPAVVFLSVTRDSILPLTSTALPPRMGNSPRLCSRRGHRHHATQKPTPPSPSAAAHHALPLALSTWPPPHAGTQPHARLSAADCRRRHRGRLPLPRLKLAAHSPPPPPTAAIASLAAAAPPRRGEPSRRLSFAPPCYAAGRVIRAPPSSFLGGRGAHIGSLACVNGRSLL